MDGLLLKPFEKSDELLEAVKQALADSRQKRDAARVHALRPLFEVTESLLSETRSDALLELIVNAILGHLRCAHAGYYQYSPEEQRFVFLRGQGTTLADFIIQVDASGSPLLVNAAGPGDANSQARLRKAGLGAAIFVPDRAPGISRRLLRRTKSRRASVRGCRHGHVPDPGPPGRRPRLRMPACTTSSVPTFARSRSLRTRLLQAEKMAAAGRLSASIAHEVNNPLQSVQNCLHLAGREDLAPAKRREYFRAGEQRAGTAIGHGSTHAGLLPTRGGQAEAGPGGRSC